MKKLIILALVISVVTGFGVYSFATNLVDRLNVKTAPVVVAIEKIPKSTIITPEMIAIKQVPVESIHELANSNPDKIIGRITLESIEANEPILSIRLVDSSQNNNSLSFSVPQNYRALTIKTDEVTGVAGYVDIGDRVDLVALMPNGTSQMIEEYMEVVENGVKSSSASDSLSTAITVLVPDQDVLKVEYALELGSYRLILRTVVDLAIDNPAPYTQ